MKILIVEDDDAIAEALASIPLLVCTANARAVEDARTIGP